MSDKAIWDTSILPRVQFKGKKKNPTVSKPHKDDDCISYHQYSHSKDQYFTLIIYNKDAVDVIEDITDESVPDSKVFAIVGKNQEDTANKRYKDKSSAKNNNNAQISTSPYINYFVYNIPGSNIENGEVLLEKDYKTDYKNGDRYNIDVYRQTNMFNEIDGAYYDDKRAKFPIEGFTKSNGLELVSRQEYCKFYTSPVKFDLGDANDTISI